MRAPAFYCSVSPGRYAEQVRDSNRNTRSSGGSPDSRLLERLSPVSAVSCPISGGNTAVFANAGVTVISDAVLSNNNSYGVYAEGAAVVNVERSQINNNAIGVLAASAGVILRLSDTALYNNNTAMACGGGALVSAGNNRRGASPNVVAPACAPTMTIQIQ